MDRTQLLAAIAALKHALCLMEQAGWDSQRAVWSVEALLKTKEAALKVAESDQRNPPHR